LGAGNVTIVHRVMKHLDVAVLEVGDELRPRLEASFPGDGQLCDGQLDRSPRAGGIRVNRADACERRWIAVTYGAEQILGELALLFEIGRNGERAGSGHKTTPSMNARVRIMG
jgi:hypothetical protein